MNSLRLYHYWRSSSSWRVRLGLSFKGIEPEYIAVNLLDDETDRPEHRARNPMGYVPVLELPPVDPQSTPLLSGKIRRLQESLAILEWLEETHPEPSFFPKEAFGSDPALKARARTLAELINAGVQPFQNPNVLEVVSADSALQKQWAQRWIRKGMSAYEALVQEETAGTFSIGDLPSFADLVLIPQCYSTRRFEVPLEEFPTIARIYERALTLPWVDRTLPERFQPK